MSSTSSSPRVSLDSTPATSPAMSPTRLEPELSTTIIEGETIDSALAARLTLCTVGHVLYLKDQIPLPISQLTRLARRSDVSTTRTSRKRTELLETISCLSYCLQSTFEELSCSFARRTARDLQLPANSGDSCRSNAQVQLILALGPTFASARSRVVINLDDFEVDPYEQDDTSETSESDEELYEDDLPPLAPGSDDDAMSSDNEGSDKDGPSLINNGKSTASPDVNYMAAERELSRAIVSRDILSATLPPTNTFILLRAPRCFNHTEWIPQPRLRKALDSYLIQCKERISVRCHASAATVSETIAGSHLNDATAEDDEMMWWAWNKKLIGFTL